MKSSGQLREAMVMLLIIVSTMAALIIAAFTLWSLLGLPSGPYSPLLSLIGGLVVACGVTSLVWTYSVFPPLRMLPLTLSGLREEFLVALKLLPSIAAMRIGGPATAATSYECSKVGERVEIVTQGPYGCVRHPVYASVLTIAAGLSLIKGPFIIVTAVLAVVYYLLGLAEERILDMKSCGRYSEVMRGKPRLNPAKLIYCMVRELSR